MVFVLNANREPLAPCHPARARQFLRDGKAAIWRKQPFTIILNELKPATDGGYRLKIDYGSRHTGLAILHGSDVVWMSQFTHKTTVKEAMQKRAGYRHRRRSANLRHRKARFNYRTRKEGWLPPSLRSRVNNIETWVRKLMRLCPITAISYENCKFDTQLLRDANTSGIKYQQGTLTGYEVREYLLEKFNRACAYCGEKNIPLEVEHIVPKSRTELNPSNRIDNLTLACHPCNQAKGNMTAEEYGKAIGKDFSEIQEQVKAPLADTALINATRWEIYDVLLATGLPVECGTGARTKMNRINLGLAKDHHFDACCVGESTPEELRFKTKDVLYIAAKGRGQHRRTNVNKHGFPVAYLPRQKQFFGFQSGDMVKAVVPTGKNPGTWYGRVGCRSSGDFGIKTRVGRRDGVNYRYIKLIQANDGYGYSFVS